MHFTRFQCLTRFAMLLLAVGFTAAPAFAATTVEVGTCLTGFVQFVNIQSAVNQSPCGPSSMSCPGIYPEQVSINKNLTLTGVADPSSNQDAAIVISPAGGVVANANSLTSGQPIAAQILVISPATAVRRAYEPHGRWCGQQSSRLQRQSDRDLLPKRLRFGDHISVAKTQGACTRPQRLPRRSGGVRTERRRRRFDGDGETDFRPQLRQERHHRQWILDTTLNAISNAVQGAGVVSLPGSAQNGIQIGFGAKGKATGNTVLDQVYGDITIASSVGILLYDAAGKSSNIKVSSNNVHNTQTALVFTLTAATRTSTAMA